MESRQAKAWTSDELEFVKTHGGRKRDRWIAEQLGRTVSGVLHKRCEFRLCNPNGKRWSYK